MVNTDWFYVQFDTFFLQPRYIALAVAAFLITVLVKAGIFVLTKYKRFDGSLLVATINTMLSGTGLFMIFFESFQFTDDLLLFISSIFGAIYLLEIIFTLLLKGRNSFVNGLVGSLLGNTFLFMIIMIGIIFTIYPII